MLQARNISKSFQQRKVVDAVSFNLVPGEIVGLLGPNGAGKSTTIGMLCGLVTPDEGSVTIDGNAISAAGPANKQRIGLVPQDIALFEELDARINLETFGALYGLRGATLTARVNAALDMVGLATRAKDRVVSFSGGMKRRLNIAAALLHDPDIMLLDEPTVGVDPQSRNAIFDNLQTLRSQGKAVLYSTHYMEEAERLCDRIVILDQGRMIANDTIANLHRMLPASNVLEIDVKGLLSPVTLTDIGNIDGVSGVTIKPSGGPDMTRISLTLRDLTDGLPHLLAAIAQSGGRVTHMVSQRDTLETLFLNLTGRALRDE